MRSSEPRAKLYQQFDQRVGMSAHNLREFHELRQEFLVKNNFPLLFHLTGPIGRGGVENNYALECIMSSNTLSAIFAAGIPPYSNPGKLNKQKITCSSTIAPPAANASFGRELSYASANTPPINVSRNGSAHSQGDDGIPVVTSATINRKQSSGAVFPK